MVARTAGSGSFASSVKRSVSCASQKAPDHCGRARLGWEVEARAHLAQQRRPAANYTVGRQQPIPQPEQCIRVGLGRCRVRTELRCQSVHIFGRRARLLARRLGLGHNGRPAGTYIVLGPALEQLLVAGLDVLEHLDRGMTHHEEKSRQRARAHRRTAGWVWEGGGRQLADQKPAPFLWGRMQGKGRVERRLGKADPGGRVIVMGPTGQCFLERPQEADRRRLGNTAASGAAEKRDARLARQNRRRRPA
eukprot:scaffold26543_cov101-Isochrysis_galbana.AAC.3